MKFLTLVVSALFSLFIGLASAAPKDFDGDGKSDVLWQFTPEWSDYLWMMSGSTYAGQFTSGKADYKIMAIGDLDGDGRADMVSFSEKPQFFATRGHQLWLSRMNGAVNLGNELLGEAWPPWTPVGFGDVNGDGHKDILWSTSGGVVAWLLAWNGSSFSYTSRDLGPVGPGWTIKGVADIDGDGIDDIIWTYYHVLDPAAVVAWLMTPAGDVGSVVQIGAVAYPWTIRKVADFDGDGKADILWQYNTLNVVWYLDGASVASVNYLPDVGTEWKIIDVGDYNGDGRNDILWELPLGGNPSNGGSIYQWLMSGRGIVDAVNWITQVAPSWQAALTFPFMSFGDPLP